MFRPFMPTLKKKQANVESLLLFCQTSFLGPDWGCFAHCLLGPAADVAFAAAETAQTSPDTKGGERSTASFFHHHHIHF